ncbi:hypothetical protein KY290_017924 [Solanum tuberosum]|uniref:LysM domain-containing protein n=2 Tax=Solanum tuberosum TaxID=4113 RepID=M1B4T9_SOLTU|nr:PREDICTED: uncharacterized protein LOC107061649 [Solanum tuberosum]KAH0686334.1 hypothetical protein KY284_016887 [Solanum tuberosum]KAH0689729.1 hypothetical protein KY289_017087 [Solanum tuberosum]KAH0704406.1 hypothetical protein KY285_018684 [Solanum tuberosum]KAH0761851.1 hypothetical protein KY290_017924 [Solanum tuberosum]
MAFVLVSGKSTKAQLVAIADAASLYCAIFILGLLLISSVKENYSTDGDGAVMKGNHFLSRPCDEIYVVREGETLHTISDKCGDPFIVEENPHIHDPDDVFPGLVIKITPRNRS